MRDFCDLVRGLLIGPLAFELGKVGRFVADEWRVVQVGVLSLVGQFGGGSTGLIAMGWEKVLLINLDSPGPLPLPTLAVHRPETIHVWADRTVSFDR